MSKMSDLQMATYRRKHPELFQDPGGPRPPLGGDPASFASEAEFQQGLVRELEARGWTVWELYKGSARGGSVWASKGLPDLYVFRFGAAFWAELKQPGNGPSPAQLARHAELRAAGINVHIVWTMQEALGLAQDLEARP